MGAILSTSGVTAWVKDLYEEAFHLNYIFPEDSNETVTFAAGGTNNVFGAWAEIVDNNSVTLSSKFNSSGHISSIIVESTSAKDNIYLIEIAYGASKTIVCRARGISGTNQISHVSQERMRNFEIPSGETVYYRLKCETASATMTLHLRYHIHE
ncbi:MAG: hypothetical protein ACXQTR_03870 [Candidatus Methanospirareceae archaeon]